MEGVLGIVVFVSFMAFIVGIVAWAGKNSLKKIKLYYEPLAEKFGLEYIPEKKLWVLVTKYPSLMGKLGDYDFTLYSYTTGGKNKTTYTQARLILNKPIVDFSIFKEGFFSKIGKSLGMQDIQVGHQELDDTFIFRSKDEIALQKIVLDDEISRMLLHLKSEMLAGIYLNRGRLTYTEVNHIHSEKKRARFQKMITLLYAIAKETEKI